MAEEVYFGKAKDVVSDLRSMYILSASWRFIRAMLILSCDRHTTSNGIEPRQGDPSADDQLHARKRHYMNTHPQRRPVDGVYE